MSLLPIEAGQPLTRTSSLIETGTPSSADNGSPFFQRRSEARAALSASLGIDPGEGVDLSG